MGFAGLLPLLKQHQPYVDLLTQLAEWQRGAKSWLLPALPPASHAYVIAALQQDIAQQSINAPLLVIVSGADDARRLYEQIILWSAQPQSVLLYPEPDILPFERAPGGDPSARQRMSVLAKLGGLTVEEQATQSPVVIASVRAVMHKTLPMRDLAAHSRILRRGQHSPLTTLVEQWLRLGYEPVSVVEEPGQMSHRGGIVDIFPVTSSEPVRLEFFGDQIDSLRCFDPTTQRSTRQIAAVAITPPAEVLPEDGPDVAKHLGSIRVDALSDESRQQWQADMERLSQRIGGAAARELWHFYAPFFYADHQPTTLLDHFDGLIVLAEMQELMVAAARLEAEADELKAGKIDRGEMIADFMLPFVPWADIASQLEHRSCLSLTAQDSDSFMSGGARISLSPLPFRLAPVYGGRLKEVLDDCQQLAKQQERIVVTSHQAKRLSALLRERGVMALPIETITEIPPPGSLTLVQGSLAEGWVLSQTDTPGLVLLTDVEIFGWAKPRRATAHRRLAAQPFLSDLAVGDYVVHVEHGVGIYRGLVKLNLDGSEREYLQIDYAQNDKLYVPTDQVDRVSRYVGVGDTAPALTTLGSTDWEHAKRRARKAVQDVAKELLAIYAARQVAPGLAFSPDTVWQGELEASFPYIETSDQLRAISEVKADMERPQPMDRLICGDVGYGKTEVALRAAFKAVMDGRQVAILVPTTILAQQHYNTFRERLAAFPVKVEMLSRFRSERAQHQIIQGLRDGSIDICIGTHRLIQKDVIFKNLALVIIDEEQRFGVMHKERLKKLRQEVDVLTLTATPIPRTLHMSLVGVRDMSTIDTPPEDRLPITTVVSVYDENLIRQAIIRELDRGGQVYFVHNRVQSIEYVTRRLQNLLPNVSFAIGHGQMPEEQLERVMLDFAAGRTDVLVCTAIIESGVDIPNANTIIINRADQFGLAQLYQLRGRVGRGANRAYAYLLHDRSFQLSATAEQRLKAIFEASTLGAGYRIAMKDLEIRGAGNILGVEQHGHIAAVGFDLYTRLLAAEVERQKEEGIGVQREPETAHDLIAQHPSVSLPVDAFLPVSYVEDDSTRLALYQRMAAITSTDEVQSMQTELVDRFGKLPPSASNLLYVLDVKARAEAADVTAITTHENEIVLKLRDGKHFDGHALARQFDQALKMGSSTIRLDRRKTGGRWRELLRVLLDALAQA